MAAYPVLDDTAISVHRPWTASKSFPNVHNDMPSGYRYSYNLLAGGIRRYQVDYGALSDAQAVLISNHFDGQCGGWESFDFVDPESADTVTVRYDQERLEIRRVGPNQNALTVILLEVI